MLGPSILLGKLFSIPVRLHWSFGLILLWVAYLQWSAGGTIGAVAGGLIFIVLMFVCVVLHELGHSLSARRFGIATRDITLSPLGGVAALSSMPRRWHQELIISLAGPAVNVVIAALLFPVVFLTFPSVEQLANPFTSFGGLVFSLFAANLVMVIFNLIPAFPMDGGRVLRSLLAARGDYASATLIAVRLGQFLAILLAVAGLFWNPFLILIAGFVFFAAQMEWRMVRMQDQMAGFRVNDLMQTQFEIAGPHESMGAVASLMRRTGQSEIPILFGDHFLGFIGRTELIRALQEGGGNLAAQHY
ncbi:MAG: site-2 protease family protein [Verrucomicrobiota bacterium]